MCETLVLNSKACSYRQLLIKQHVNKNRRNMSDNLQMQSIHK